MYNGEELLLMLGKGGMKRLAVLAAVAAPAPTIAPPAPINNLTLELSGNLCSESSVMVTMLDFEKGMCMNEIIDTNVLEKRRCEDLFRRCVKPPQYDDDDAKQSQSQTQNRPTPKEPVISGRDSSPNAVDAAMPDARANLLSSQIFPRPQLSSYTQ